MLSLCGPAHPKHKFQHLLYLEVPLGAQLSIAEVGRGSCPRAVPDSRAGAGPALRACWQSSLSFSIPATSTAALLFIFSLVS